MAASRDLKALVDAMPDPDARGMYCTDIDKVKIEKTVAEIAKGGKDNVLAIIDMLGEPGSDQDVKPHYALHCLANYVLQSKDETARAEFSAAVASQLSGGRSKYVRGFLCQELQWAGRREAVPALAKLLLDEELADPAAMALVAIRDGAAEALRAALPSARGRCRLVILHSLAALADRQAIDMFQRALHDSDREVRLAAGAGLARIGAAKATEALLKAADVPPGWERIQQTKHCLVLAEKLAAAGKKTEAARIYGHLRSSRSGPAEEYVRQAAERGLAAPE
jgi:HEAT repeat protein